MALVSYQLFYPHFGDLVYWTKTEKGSYIVYQYQVKVGKKKYLLQAGSLDTFFTANIGMPSSLVHF